MTIVTYVVLTKFTDQGMRNAKDSPKRADASSAMSLSLSLGALGNVRTESLRAFSAAEMATVAGKMI